MVVSKGDEVKQCWRIIGIVYLITRVQQRKRIGASELLLELCTSSHNHLPRKREIFQFVETSASEIISFRFNPTRIAFVTCQFGTLRFVNFYNEFSSTRTSWKCENLQVTRAAIMFQQKCVKFRESCNLLPSPEALLCSLHKRNNTSFYKPHKLCRSIKSSFVIRLVVDMSMMLQG